MIFAAESVLHEGQRTMTTERLVNMYAEIGKGREEVTLRSVPGLTQIGRASNQPIRAMVANGNHIYFCTHKLLYRWNGGAFTNLGGISDDTQTTMALSETECAVVASGSYFIYDGSTVQEINGQAFGNFGSVEYLDGYFVFTESGGARFAISGLNNGESLDPLDFASAEYRPDNLRRIVVNRGEIRLFGEETIEPWENTGGTDFPFSRVANTIMERGIKQTSAAAKMDNSIIWAGEDDTAYRETQYTPQRISTHSIEAALRGNSLTNVFEYEWEGHKFACFRFSDRPAWIYDAASQLWHERATGVALGPWEVTCTAKFQGKWYAGTAGGHICRFDPVHQDRGGPLRREAQSAIVEVGGKPFILKNLDIQLDASTGATIMSQFSVDAGRTWTDERERELTADNNRTRLFWKKLWRARKISARLAVTDNADFAIFGAAFDV